MARVTVEDCLRKVDNRFELIHLAAKRVRQLRKGAEPLVVCKNKDVVVSLREIAAGAIFPVKEGRVSDYTTQASIEEQTEQEETDKPETEKDS